MQFMGCDEPCRSTNRVFANTWAGTWNTTGYNWKGVLPKMSHPNLKSIYSVSWNFASFQAQIRAVACSKRELETEGFLFFLTALQADKLNSISSERKRRIWKGSISPWNIGCSVVTRGRESPSDFFLMLKTQADSLRRAHTAHTQFRGKTAAEPITCNLA